jgi:hypothetical protein
VRLGIRLSLRPHPRGVSFKPRAPSRREIAFRCAWLFDK